jgi:hypothetical protein
MGVRRRLRSLKPSETQRSVIQSPPACIGLAVSVAVKQAAASNIIVPSEPGEPLAPSKDDVVTKPARAVIEQSSDTRAHVLAIEERRRDLVDDLVSRADASI